MIIKPFNFLHILMFALVIASIFIIKKVFKNSSEKTKKIFLIGLCCFDIILFIVYKIFLSMDGEFLRISGIEKFNWYNELPLQLCNINMFLIPIGLLTKKRGVMGFAFFLAPLGAAMALIFPEQAFSGYSVFLPRIIGFYLTHCILIVAGLSLSILGFFRPTFKDFSGIYATFFIVAGGAHLVNTFLRLTVCPFANYFFTYDASVSLLALFWKYIPVPFLYEMPALLILITYMGIVTLIYSKLDSKKQGECTDLSNEKKQVG